MDIQAFKQFIIDKLNKELPSNLYYHGTHHTLAVYKTCLDYITYYALDNKEAELLKIGALLHDIGFIWTYNDHENLGVKKCHEILIDWNVHEEDIMIINGLISATSVPQKPKTFLEKIICDADLDYLGTNYCYTISELLYKELLERGMVENEEKWDEIQVKFLLNHHYHTDYAISNRKPGKLKYLKEIIDKRGWHNKFQQKNQNIQ